MLIDGVFSGGGIKGFSLIGGLLEVERRGFVFKRLAGTSAGAILAGLVAAGYKGEEIITLMETAPLENLLDSPKFGVPFPFVKWLRLYWSMGLYKGEALEKWIASILAAKGIYTFKDLPYQSLRVIASDLTNNRMLVLPDDLPKYDLDPNQFSVAKAIRMSCSIPYFFQPVKLKSNGKRYIVVDGGVLSNFPIWLFDEENVMQTRPVLGLKLVTSVNKGVKQEIDNAIEIFTSLFETMKDAHDARYISRKLVKNIIFIPVDGVLAIDFNVTTEKRRKLVQAGEMAAQQFFTKWSY